jgi:hypothetical protein
VALHVHRPVVDPDQIAVLIPSRGRAEGLRSLLQSYERSTSRKDKLEVWVYADSDDAPTIELLKENPFSFPLHAVVGGATDTQGEMYNIMRAAKPDGAGIYMISGDKGVFDTPDWDGITRQAFDAVPDRVLYAYPRDSFNKGSFGTYSFISGEFANAIGRIFTEHFPFWYDDKWLFELGLFIGRKRVLDYDVELKLGPTMRMQNLLFWEHFYHQTLDERLRDSEALARLIYAANPEGYEDWRKRRDEAIAQSRASLEANPAHDQTLLQWERQYGVQMKTASPRPAAGSRYREVEGRAVQALLAKVVPALARGDERWLKGIEGALLRSSESADLQSEAVRTAVARGDTAQAFGFAKGLLDRFPNFPEGYLHLVDLLRTVGRGEDAQKLIEAAARLFPTHPPVLQRLVSG